MSSSVQSVSRQPGVRAAIYARQSLDRSGEGAAVERQVDDCLQIAERRGWSVIETITDNDMSASTGKPRPGYQRLLSLMRSRAVDAVIVWHVDRLTRRLVDLEEVITICESTGVRLATVTGDIDLGTDTGRMLARILASVARGEVERKGARQRRANEQRAAGGKMGWTRRPFGYDKQDGVIVVVDAEARGLERAAEMVLAGETLAAAVRMLDGEGLRTTIGKTWNITSLRRALLSPRYAGRVTYHDVDVTEGQWPVILPADMQERLSARLRDVSRRLQQGTEARHLLSGLARCGRCDAVMFATTAAFKGQRYLIYRCLACYLTRRADYVDELVEQLVIARLSQPDAAAVFAEEADVGVLRSESAELRGRRDDLAALLADGLLSATAVRERSQGLTRRINDIDDQISRALGESPVIALTAADDVRAAWDALDVRTRKQVVDILLTVTILPAGKGQRFSPEQVRMEWKS